jgi:hypothetical protein
MSRAKSAPRERRRKEAEDSLGGANGNYGSPLSDRWVSILLTCYVVECVPSCVVGLLPIIDECTVLVGSAGNADSGCDVIVLRYWVAALSFLCVSFRMRRSQISFV